MHDIRNSQEMVATENYLRSITASKSKSSSISDLTRSSAWNGQLHQKRTKEKVYFVEDLLKRHELLKRDEK